MRYAAMALVLACIITPLLAQENAEGPIREKAQKTYKEASEYLHRRMTEAALECFKKADKQDGGHCLSCQKKMVKYGMELRDWKTAESAASEMIAEAEGDKNKALAHYEFGVVLLNEGVDKRKDGLFTRAHDEMTKALRGGCQFPGCHLCRWAGARTLEQGRCGQATVRAVCKDETTGQSGSAACVAIYQSPRAGTGQDGASIRSHDNGRTACLAG